MGVETRDHAGTYRRLAAVSVTLLLCASWAARADAGQFEDASAAYERGDYATAHRLITPLAEQGNAKAQYNLGVMYHKGEGVPQDYNETMKWFRMAAVQGYAMAQYNLGSMYHKGEGVAQDYAETMKWYRRAAEQGLADAQYFLGAMYGRGQGVPQDNVRAYMWFSLAESRFDESELEKRQMVILTRGIIAAEMTPDQIAEAQRLAREWKPKEEGT